MKRLMRGDVDQVKRIFPVYFVASLSLFDALRPSVLPEAPHLAESELHLASAPVIDLLDLSGYARLFSEYHQDAQLWQPIGSLWEKYVHGNNGALNRLAAIISLGSIPFHLPHRGILRTNWQIAVQRHIRQGTGGGEPEDFLFGGRKVNHPSALVRYFVRSDFTDGVDIIVGDFFFKVPGGELLSWGQRRPQDFQDALEQDQEGDGEE